MEQDKFKLRSNNTIYTTANLLLGAGSRRVAAAGALHDYGDGLSVALPLSAIGRSYAQNGPSHRRHG